VAPGTVQQPAHHHLIHILYQGKTNEILDNNFPGECGQHVVETWTEEQILKSRWYRNWVYMMVQADKAH
jgi:hypothetical protein